jgi:hypothetical protein
MELTVFALQAMIAFTVLEILKQLAYKVKPDLNINPALYPIFLTALSFGALPFASWLALGGALDFTLWTSELLRQTLVSVLSAVAALFGYTFSIKPLKTAIAAYKAGVR